MKKESIKNLRAFKGIWIPAEIWLSEDLSDRDKIILAEIDSLDNIDGCFATNKYFANFFNLSIVRVSNIISNLIEKKYITSSIDQSRGNRRVLRVLKKTLIPSQKILYEGLKESDNHNNKESNSINISLPSTEELALSEIFDHWNSMKEKYPKMRTHLKLTDDIKRKIKSTLKNFSQKDISISIQNYAQILQDDKYYFNYAWTLKDFLSRGLEKFNDFETADRNFRRDKKSISNFKPAPKQNIKCDYCDLPARLWVDGLAGCSYDHITKAKEKRKENVA